MARLLWKEVATMFFGSASGLAHVALTSAHGTLCGCSLLVQTYLVVGGLRKAN